MQRRAVFERHDCLEWCDLDLAVTANYRARCRRALSGPHLPAEQVISYAGGLWLD